MDVTINQVAEGKTFDFKPVSEIKTDELTVFEFENDTQQITIETNEFSAVCPFSGLPDIAYLRIMYVPESKLCVELKSFKYYMNSFRNVGIYQEGVTARIYNDMRKVLKTNRIQVLTTYNTRGGFDTTCIEGSI